MSNELISWPKKYRNEAKAQGKALVAYGYDGSTVKPGETGGMQAVGPCDDRAAQIICMFATKVHHGIDYKQAFAEVVEAVEASDGRRRLKAETPGTGGVEP